MARFGRMSSGLPDVDHFAALPPKDRWREFTRYIRRYNTLPPPHAALRAATAAELLEDGRTQAWIAALADGDPSAVSRVLRRFTDQACQQPTPQGAAS